MNMNYTDSQLIEFIQTLADTLGKTPGTRDLPSAPNYPTAHTYAKRFGSWNHALELAGFTPTKRTITPEFLLSELNRFYEEFGRSPTPNDLDSNSNYPSRGSYKTHFGGYKSALKLCRLPIKHPRTPEEQVLHRKEYRERWYVDNPTYNKEYRMEHMESKRIGDAQYRLTHKKERMEYVRDNPEKFKKYSARRCRDFGFNPLNALFENSHAHHLHIKNADDVMHIPTELHKSVWHSYKDESKMSYINSIVLNWWLDTQYIHSSTEEIDCVLTGFNL